MLLMGAIISGKAEMCYIDPQQRQQEYLLRATECERSTSATLDPIAAKTYCDMARQWRELAAQSAQAFPANRLL